MVQLGTIDLAVFAVFMVVVLATGMFAARRAGSSKREYYLAGDKLAWWMIGASMVAANVSSHHFIGVMGTAYHRGFVAMAIEWPTIIITFNALLWIFLPFYLRNGFYTVPEYLERRFGGASRLIYSLFILVAYVFIEISAVLYMGAIAAQTLLGVPIWWTIIGMALLIGLYTIAGGLRSVVWTEMLQLGILLTGGLVLSLATIRAVGGWSEVMAGSDDWHLLMPASDPDFPWTMFAGAVFAIGVFYGATNQFMVQRVLAAKNEWHARMGVIFADYLKFLLPLIIIVPGVVGQKLYPSLEKPDAIFPTLVQGLLPQGLVGLVIAALMAAVMSHVSGALNSSTTIACVDIYLPYINRKATERQAVLFGRIVGIVVLLMGVIWARVLVSHSEKPIFLYLLNAYGYFTPGISTMFLVGIFWKRTTHAGAVTAALVSIPLAWAIEVAFPGISFMNRTGIVFWLCVALCVAVSLFTRPKPAEQLEGLIWNPQSLRLPESLRAASHGLRNPIFWWAIVNAAVIYMYIVYR